jgi:hypothetical protein
MYPLATGVMFAVGNTLDRFRASVGIGDIPVPWWQWVVMIGVFLVFFRIDNQLGLRKNYYIVRHATRLGVLVAL